MQIVRKISLSGSLLLALLLIATMWVGLTAAAASPAKFNTFPTVRAVDASRFTNSNADLLHPPDTLWSTCTDSACAHFAATDHHHPISACAK